MPCTEISESNDDGVGMFRRDDFVVLFFYFVCLSN